jgi:tetratricopeptide (TPR) repeat protein
MDIHFLDFRFISMRLFFFLIFSSLAVFADELTDEAQRLIDSDQVSQAYELLIAELEERAGTPEYDLLLGIAALESGHPTQAVFAFERVLAVDPDNSRARLELARTYFELGENEASREEFNSARTQEVPEEVNATIEEYLTAIDSRIRAVRQQRRFSMYLQARLGYDSNVNSATDSSTVALPAFGNLVFTLDDTARELDSGFYAVEGGLSFSAMIVPDSGLSLFGSASAFHRPTWSEHRFDTSAGSAQIGLRHTGEKNSLLFSVLGQKYLIDGDSNRDQAGFNLQWLHLAGQSTQISLFAQGLLQNFPDQDVRDVNQYSGGAGLVHLFPGNGSPLIYASIYAGIDDEQDNNRPDIGRTFAGIRAGGEYSFSGSIKWLASASYQYSKYGDEDPLFQDRRTDNFIFLRSGFEFSAGDNFVVVPELRYLINDSNIIINEFDRWQGFITARFNFF